MPEISRISLESRVTDRLHAAALDLLPGEYLDNPVVKWVVAHDSLCGSKAEADSYGDDPWIGALAECIASEIQPKVSFYFGSLFHIARMRSVSLYCRQNVELLNSGANRERSAANLAELSSDRFGIEDSFSPEYADAVLQKLSGIASENAIKQEGLASHWWKIWIKEAGVLYNAAKSFNETLRDGEFGYKKSRRELFRPAFDLLRACNEECMLQESMKKEGVRFKDASVNRRSGLLGSIGAPVLIAMMAGGHEPDDGYIWREFVHTMDAWRRSERERRMQPQVDIALDMLKSKYGDRNPFDDYLPLVRPADSALRDLCFEHRLPNGENSPWLSNWTSRLEGLYSGGKYNPLPLPGHEKVDWAVRMADSAIKRNVCELILPTEDWSRFIQRLYEAYCVKELGEGAGGANAKAEKDIWTGDSFCNFIGELTYGVTALGYAVCAPADSRLRSLLKKAVEGYVRAEDW